MWRNLCLKPFCGLWLQLPSLSSLLIQLILSFSYILQAPLYGKNNLEVQLVQVVIFLSFPPFLAVKVAKVWRGKMQVCWCGACPGRSCTIEGPSHVFGTVLYMSLPYWWHMWFVRATLARANHNSRRATLYGSFVPIPGNWLDTRIARLSWS